MKIRGQWEEEEVEKLKSEEELEANEEEEVKLEEEVEGEEKRTRGRRRKWRSRRRTWLYSKAKPVVVVAMGVGLVLWTPSMNGWALLTSGRGP